MPIKYFKHIDLSDYKYGLSFGMIHKGDFQFNLSYEKTNLYQNSLYENKDLYKVIDSLKTKGLIYEKDNATWFEGTKVGRDSDRVLIKSTGEPTYRLPDMAYHIDKYKRQYNLIIDILGADHMDAYPDIL